MMIASQTVRILRRLHSMNRAVSAELVDELSLAREFWRLLFLAV